MKAVLCLIVLISFLILFTGAAFAEGSGFYFNTNATQPYPRFYPDNVLDPYYVPPAPYVIATDPPNNAVDVPVNQPVSIVFNEDVYFGVDQWSKFSTAFDDSAMNHVFPEGIKLQNGSRPGQAVLWDGRWPNVIWFYADTEAPWPSDSTIIVKILPGAVYVQDFHNRSKDNQKPARFLDVKNVQGYTLKFTTVAGLVPTGMVYPGNNSGNMPLDPEIKILFNHNIAPGPIFASYDMYQNITLRPITDAVLDKNGKRINPTATPVPILKTIAGNNLAIRPNNTILTQFTGYQITLPAGSLRATDNKDMWLSWSLTIPFSTMKTNGTGSKDITGGTGSTDGSKGASPPSGSEISVVLAPLLLLAGAVFRSCLRKR